MSQLKRIPENIYFRLRFGFANTIDTYLKLKRFFQNMVNSKIIFEKGEKKSS